MCVCVCVCVCARARARARVRALCVVMWHIPPECQKQIEKESDKNVNPFVLLNLEPKCAPGDAILYPESIFCYSP